MVLFVGFTFAQQVKKATIKKQNVTVSHEKAIAGSITTSSFYVPSSTADIVFTLDLSSADYEFADKISLTFPAGLTPTAGTPATIDAAGQGGGEVLNAIAGQTISWGDNDNYFGGITVPGTYTITVSVTAGAITGNKTVDYAISGDQYGAAPNDITGTVVVSEAPACMFPANLGLSSLTTTDATLTWESLGTLWNVKWGVAGFAGAGTAITGLTAKTTSISGLTASTAYDFYVQNDCGGSGTSTWTGPYTFTTPCAAVSLPFSEGFESTIGCWSQFDKDGDTYQWDVSTGITTHSGTGVITSSSYDNTAGALTPENWLVSPNIDLSTAIGSGALTLKYYVVAVDQAWPSEHYKVVVSTTGAASTANFTDILVEETITAGAYFEKIVNLDAYAGQTINIAFVHFNCTDMFAIAIDDVSVFENVSTDAAITDILLPTNETGCLKTATESVKVKIANTGGSSISNFPVSIKVDGNTIATETVSSSIAPAGTLDYTFTANLNLSALAYYQVQAVVSVAGDVDSTNDTFTKEVRSTDGQITVTVAADSVGAQSWYILNSLNDTVASHGGYQWGVTVITDVCVLNNDCYNFNWVYADQGTNNVTVAYNGTVKETIDLTANYTIAQIAGCPSAVETVNNDIFSVYPNPTSGILTIETLENSTISIFNIMGEEVIKMTTTQNSSKLDMSKLSNGAYLVKVVSENNDVMTRKINLIK